MSPSRTITSPASARWRLSTVRSRLRPGSRSASGHSASMATSAGTRPPEVATIFSSWVAWPWLSGTGLPPRVSVKRPSTQRYTGRAAASSARAAGWPVSTARPSSSSVIVPSLV